jgi:hypothetical protein
MSGRPAASGGTSVGVLTCSYRLIKASCAAAAAAAVAAANGSERRSLRLARLQQPTAQNGVRLERVYDGVHGAARARVRCGKERAPRVCACVLRARTLGLQRTHASGSGSSVSLRLGKSVVCVVHACAAPHERRGVLQSAAQRARAAVAKQTCVRKVSAAGSCARIRRKSFAPCTCAHVLCYAPAARRLRRRIGGARRNTKSTGALICAPVDLACAPMRSASAQMG